MTRHSRRWLMGIASACVILAFGATGAQAQQGEVRDAEPDASASGEELLQVVNDPWTGDLDGIRERRLLRVLTVYNRSDFFISQGQGRGLEFEAMTRFGAWLEHPRTPDALRGGKAVSIRVVFVPVERHSLIPALLEGRGDVIAAGMTVTPERAAQVRFADPYIKRVDEVLVRHKDAPALASIDELAGRSLVLVRGSSYVASAKALSERLVAAGKPAIRIIEAPANLEGEDLMELANAGTIQYTIIDSHAADLWAKLLTDIVVQEDVAVASGGAIAWAVRPDAPALKAALDGFIEPLLADRATSATIFRRYYAQTTFIRNPLAVSERDRLRQLAPHFRAVSDQVGFAWLLMAAQGFQESRLDPNATSRVGALGVMQLMPATGKEMGVNDLRNAQQNIHGGVRYMEKLRETYFNDPDLAPDVQIQFALAGYNAGPNRINRLRQEAAKQGLDPNQWFGHVERVVQQKVGSEPVRYVANIFAYYATYAMAADLLADREEDLAELRAAMEGK